MNRQNSLTKIILHTLEKSIDGYVRLEDFMYNTHIYAGGYDRPLKKNSLSQALKRVREKGWIELITASPKPRFLKAGMKGKIGFKLPLDGSEAVESLRTCSQVRKTLRLAQEQVLNTRKPRLFKPRKLINDEEIIIKLTDQGREKAILTSFENEKWDGRWRVVIFDIPEKRRVARDLLRGKLKTWGFKKWQKSVWATKKNCTKEIRDFIKSVGISEWVLVLESDNIDL